METQFKIGTAAWTIPKQHAEFFPVSGSHLERYAECLNAVEINTSFYRDHKARTYARWRDSVGDAFRFSVKLSKTFTHEFHLKPGPKDLAANLRDVMELDEKLGCILVQLPPSLIFVETDAATFLDEMRETYQGPIAFEPRHASWDEPEALALQKRFQISRVIADPQPYFARSWSFADFHGVAYLRLHGSPEIYQSRYDDASLDNYARELRGWQTQGLECWCIFDNTTFGHATEDALRLQRRLDPVPNPSRDDVWKRANASL